MPRGSSKRKRGPKQQAALVPEIFYSLAKQVSENPGYPNIFHPTKLEIEEAHSLMISYKKKGTGKPSSPAVALEIIVLYLKSLRESLIPPDIYDSLCTLSLRMLQKALRHISAHPFLSRLNYKVTELDAVIDLYKRLKEMDDAAEPPKRTFRRGAQAAIRERLKNRDLIEPIKGIYIKPVHDPGRKQLFDVAPESRLLCITSLTKDGVPKKQLKDMQRRFNRKLSAVYNSYLLSPILSRKFTQYRRAFPQENAKILSQISTMFGKISNEGTSVTEIARRIGPLIAKPAIWPTDPNQLKWVEWLSTLFYTLYLMYIKGQHNLHNNQELRYLQLGITSRKELLDAIILNHIKGEFFEDFSRKEAQRHLLSIGPQFVLDTPCEQQAKELQKACERLKESEDNALSIELGSLVPSNGRVEMQAPAKSTETKERTLSGRTLRGEFGSFKSSHVGLPLTSREVQIPEYRIVRFNLSRRHTKSKLYRYRKASYLGDVADFDRDEFELLCKTSASILKRIDKSIYRIPRFLEEELKSQLDLDNYGQRGMYPGTDSETSERFSESSDNMANNEPLSTQNQVLLSNPHAMIFPRKSVTSWDISTVYRPPKKYEFDDMFGEYPHRPPKPKTREEAGGKCMICGIGLGIIFGRGTNCSYCGRLLCDKCSSGNDAVPPHQIIQKGDDTKKHPMCKACYSHIKKTYDTPMISLAAFKPEALARLGITERVEAIDKIVDSLIHRFSGLVKIRNPYFLFSVLESETDVLGLLDNRRKISLKNLEQIKEGKILPRLHLLEKFIRRIDQ